MSARRWATAGGGVVLVAAVVVAVMLVSAGGGGPSHTTGPVTVSYAGGGPRARRVPASFLGFSIETSTVHAYLGSARRPNRAFRALLARLGRAQGTPVALRVGGNSTDESWWNPSGRPRPPGVLNDLGPRWAAALAATQRALRSPLALGVNLARDDLPGARALLRGVTRAGLAGPGLARVELGNEPDLYTRPKTFRVGALVVRRPREHVRYGPRDYARVAARYAVALRGRAVLSAGGFAQSAWAQPALRPLLAGAGGAIGELTAHAYALGKCDDPTAPAQLRAALLTDDAAASAVGTIRPYLPLVTARRPLRVSELNSAVCGGAERVSDTMAAALWAPGALFALLGAGVEQADVHTWQGAIYAPFSFARGRATVRPLYDALLLFATAAPSGSRLATVGVANGGDDVRAWGTTGPRPGERHVLVVNRYDKPREVRIAWRGAGTVQLLRAAGTGATRAPLAAPVPAVVRDGRARVRLAPTAIAVVSGR